MLSSPDNKVASTEEESTGNFLKINSNACLSAQTTRWSLHRKNLLEISSKSIQMHAKQPRQQGGFDRGRIYLKFLQNQFKCMLSSPDNKAVSTEEEST
jgi:hypothetical protein